MQLLQWRIVGLKLIAEGVEDEDQLYMLKQLKCDCVQGFLFSRPIAESELLKLPPHIYNTNKNMLVT